jgi:drug/metabolite transporter (DMT)-like permease
MKSDQLRVWLALAALYLIWGSTYIGIRIALEGFPPLLMAGMRFVIAGAILYFVVRARGAERPTMRQWGGSLLVGTLLVCANGCVSIAEQWVSSGVAAVAIASVPLWAALFAGLFGRWPSRGEWVGLAIGICGVFLLQSAGEMRASPQGALVLTLSCVSWALGSMWSRRLPLPQGLMASAAQMLAGGAVLFAAALVHGERLAALPSARPLVAFVYLVLIGSIVAYSAYAFLLQRVRPALATSYAYVNPVIALALGAALAGEAIAPRSLGALGLILGGVAMVALSRAPA